MDEVWKTITGFERYSVSNLGRVKNNKTKRILKPRVSDCKTKEYAKVALSVEGKAHQKFVHRLVVAAFVQELKNTDIVNHKDGLKTNNRLENLEICDSSVNARHSYALRSKIGQLDAVFIPAKNSTYQGLFISIAHKEKDEGLLNFLQLRNFKCLKCNDRNEIKHLVKDYFGF